MANLASVTTNFFATADEIYSDNLSGSIAAGAATVPVNSNNRYTDGDIVVLTVEPGTANEATFIGVKASTPARFTNCVWTEGNTGVGHAAGATVIDYIAATHQAALVKGILQFANQDGSLKTAAVRTALGLGATAVNGWEVLPYTLAVSSGYNKGNKEFDLTVAGADLRSSVSEGMRLRVQRGTAAPTQCTNLVAASSQYAAKSSPAGMTFTDDYTIEANIKLNSYGNSAILQRLTGALVGWKFGLNSTGNLQVVSAASNVSYRNRYTYRSVPLGRWVHVAVTVDMSAGSYVFYIDGEAISAHAVGDAGTPAALIQGATDMIIGRDESTNYFNGEISDVRLWNVVRTATQIRDNMNQQLVGTETNLIGYWKLNGNFNDSTSNANHMTGSGGAVATTVDNPMHDTEYAIVLNVAYSAPNTTITVFTGTDYLIPNMTLSSPYYSTQRAPYGFPASKDKWIVEFLSLVDLVQTAAAVGAWTNPYSAPMLQVPRGGWKLLFEAPVQGSSGANVADMYTTLSTANNSESDRRYSTRTILTNPVNQNHYQHHARSNFVRQSAATTWYINMRTQTASNSQISLSGSQGAVIIRAECGAL